MKKSLKIKECTTKKLFYKKWLYKIVIECGGLSSLHRRGIEYIQTVQPINNGNVWLKSSTQTIAANRRNLIEIASKLEDILTVAPHQIRTEGGSSAIFTKSEKMINEVHVQLKSYVVEIHRPDDKSQADFLLSNKNKIICKQLPLTGYRYKVHFKNGEIKRESMDSFLKWAKNFEDGRIHIPKSTKRILEGETYPMMYGNYFYAKDQKMATMALMVMGDYLNKSEEFILKSELNA